MSHCEDCYGVNTVEPCVEVGCLETNYGKCITYSGSPLYCATGGVGTFTFTGLAVAPGANTTVVVNATGGSGSSAQFSVTRTVGATTYTVVVSTAGTGYTVGNTLTIAGTLLGGSSPANDITISVTGLIPLISSTSTLDAAITNLHQRICTLTPSGLSYTGFNYSCLRVGGALTGVGTAITTAQQFTEATAAALCSLHTRTLALETPAFTVPSCIGTLTSGVSTLGNILTEYGSRICTIYSGIIEVTGVTVPGACTFTATPSTTAGVGVWFDWITDNLCAVNTNLSSSITTLNTAITTINTFLGSTTKFNNSANCLTALGGTATDSAHATIGYLTTKVCAVDTTVNAIPTYIKTDSIGLSWVGCFGSAPYSYTNTATTIQTQLQRIVNVLNTEKTSYDATYFSLSTLPCGSRSVTLTPAAIFSCSSLNTCSIDALGDVVVTSPSDPHVLYYNGTNWVNKNINALVTFTSSDSSVSITPTTIPGNLNVNLTVPNAASNRYDLSPTTITNLTNGNSTDFTLTPGSGYCYGVKQGTNVTLNGNIKLTNAGGGSITYGAALQIATVPGALTPSHNAYIDVTILMRLTPSPFTVVSAIEHGVISITSAGAVILHPYFETGSLAFATIGQNVEIVLGGKSYSTLA